MDSLPLGGTTSPPTVAYWRRLLVYLQSESKYTLAIGLQFFRSLHDTEFSLLMAASTLVVLPIIAIFFVFQRFFIEGFSVGSVKG